MYIHITHTNAQSIQVESAIYMHEWVGGLSVFDILSRIRLVEYRFGSLVSIRGTIVGRIVLGN